MDHCSKSVADLKVRFPPLHESVKSLLTSDMDRMAVEECFLKEEPERLESALKRCKKLTGTLVTLKRFVVIILLCILRKHIPLNKGSKMSV